MAFLNRVGAAAGNSSFSSHNDVLSASFASGAMPLPTSASAHSGSPMGSVGATLLARGLAANRSLTYLNLSSNRIDDDGLTALCDAIKVPSVACSAAVPYC